MINNNNVIWNSPLIYNNEKLPEPQHVPLYQRVSNASADNIPPEGFEYDQNVSYYSYNSYPEGNYGYNDSIELELEQYIPQEICIFIF